MPDYEPSDRAEHGPGGEDTSSPRQGLSRRQMMQATGAVAAAAGAAGAVWAPGAEAATAGAASPAAGAKQARTGTIKDLKHVVVFMQENRSFDHYFGTIATPGAAGFADKQVIQFANGQSLFYQPDASRTDGGYLLPYRLDTTQYDGQASTPTMGYFEAADLPFQQALARAYTVGDHYFMSLPTPTEPNRIMMWTGTNDPTGANGGPAVTDGYPEWGFTWETYCETLQNAGVNWQIYVNAYGPNATQQNPFLHTGDDLTIYEFARLNPATASPADLVPGQGLIARAGILNNPSPALPDGVTEDPSAVDYVLRDFIADCAAGTLPEVSWIVSPTNFTEHPGDGVPNYGAVYTNRVIQALHDNPDLWDSTLLILMYDENNLSFFDHVPRPVPEPGTPGENTPGLLPGTGWRVPLTLVSPWTRGGWVAKETFDHTSTIQFLEVFTASLGKPAICPNISAWRRSVFGDLTSAVDFTSFDDSFPELPTPAELLAVATTDAGLPPVPEPAPGEQTFPVQTPQGPLQVRPAPYQQNVTVAVDRSAGTVTATLTNPSRKAASMLAFPGSVLATPFAYNIDTSQIATPNTVSGATGPKTYAADVTDGEYFFAVYGPDHFIRSFAGTVVPAGDNDGQVPVVDAQLSTGNHKTLDITLANQGGTAVQFTLTPNDYEGKTSTVTLHAGDEQHTVKWPTNQYGYYDVTVTADTASTFAYRYAGRIS